MPETSRTDDKHHDPVIERLPEAAFDSLFNTQGNSIDVNYGKTKQIEAEDFISGMGDVESKDDDPTNEFMYDLNVTRRVEIEKLNQIRAASMKLKNRL